MYCFLACILAVIMLFSPGFAVAETEATPAPPIAVTAPPAVAPEKAAPPESTGIRFRVGYVDMMKVAAESDAGKVAKAHFEAKADRHKAQIDTKQKLLEKQKANLEAKLPTYTPEQRTAKIKDYEKKVNELKKMLEKADKEMRPMQEELTKELFGKIEAAAQAYGAANGFSIILEKRELLYLGKGIDAEDVTAILIAELNKK